MNPAGAYLPLVTQIYGHKSENTTYTSIEDVSELMVINISQINVIQNPWFAADEHFQMVVETNPFGLSYSVCDQI